MTETYGITKEQFEAYEAVRRSGIINMNDLTAVAHIANTKRRKSLLNHGNIIEIQKHYQELTQKYDHQRYQNIIGRDKT